MPCICYGAVSGREEFDNFIKSEEGKKTLELLKESAGKIKSFDLHPECFAREFHEVWIKCFVHLLEGCSEK